ncbi:hypothetical protein [Nonlabens sp.]|uniref:hypothetical protein n=1 Tax=Nonlabens sp. TaxID=1888209 RepID=UPI001BD01F45|nr:hypothetical protein [Nonlabens sp.]
MRKLIYTVLTVACLIGTTQAYAQESNEDFKYRRSSLSMILIESESFPNKDAVMSSWNNYPFPDKYNKHDIDLKSFNINSIVLSEQELLSAGFLKDTLTNPLQIAKAIGSLKPVKYLNAEESIAVVMPTEKQEYQLKIDKVINDNKLANKVVEKWFNRSADGKFDMSLIQERGFYNASELEASIAQGQTKGLASLGDAGEELIRNSFVTFTKLEFIENEPAAALVRDAAKAQIAKSMAGKPQMFIDKALQAADAAYEKTKEGYSLWSKTWLYQLSWNEEIAAIFYNDLWSDPSAFDKSDLFSLEFVGVQYNQSLVTFKIGETRTQEQIIDLALVRNVNNAFAKLQKQNDVFKPKVPVISVNPITAQIGMKEGLKGGEKFDVLEMTLNSKTGLTEYKKVGSVQADKKIVWDNRYNAGEQVEQMQDKNGNPINGTAFKGSKKIQSGMLLKQVK